MDYSVPGSSILGIFQARVLEWVAISFSNPTQKQKSKNYFLYLFLKKTHWVILCCKYFIMNGFKHTEKLKDVYSEQPM